MTPPAATVAGRPGLGTRTAPRVPRRVSGPARRPPSARGGATTRKPAARRAPAAQTPLAVRVWERLQRLADSRLLDRLVRGRLWIPIVACGLVGVVFLQVSMLRMNAGIGRDVEAIGKLERTNSVMRADVSRMEAGERIQSAARGVGMVVPADGAFHYVTAGGADAAALAVGRMKPPDAQALANASAQGQAQALAQTRAAQPGTATTTTAAPATTGSTSATGATTTGTATTASPPAASTPAGTSPPSSTSTPTTSAPATSAPPAGVAGGAAAPAGGQQ